MVWFHRIVFGRATRFLKAEDAEIPTSLLPPAFTVCRDDGPDAQANQCSSAKVVAM